MLAYILREKIKMCRGYQNTSFISLVICPAGMYMVILVKSLYENMNSNTGSHPQQGCRHMKTRIMIEILKKTRKKKAEMSSLKDGRWFEKMSESCNSKVPKISFSQGQGRR